MSPARSMRRSTSAVAGPYSAMPIPSGSLVPTSVAGSQAENETAPTEELPRPVPVSGPVESPVLDPALTPAPGTLPPPGRVVGRVSSRVLPPVSGPVTIRAAPPWAPKSPYGEPCTVPTPFVHDFTRPLRLRPQSFHTR